MGSCNTIQTKNDIYSSPSNSNYNQTNITNLFEYEYIKGDYLLPEAIASRGKINSKYIVKTELIGKGASGTVSIGKDKNGKNYAIKSINKSMLKDPKKLIEEVKISLSLSHPHIIKYYEAYENVKNVSIVMDLIEGGDLYEYILSKPTGQLQDEMTINILIQILETVDYLHNKMQICHRDLKPENFLVSFNKNKQKPIVKLIDFGFATRIKNGEVMKEFLGTPLYTAPEIMKGKEYDEKVDLWSIGIILFNMTTGCHPFVSRTYTSIEDQVKYKQIKFEQIKNEKIRKLCCGLLERNPLKRMDAKKALIEAKEIQRDIIIEDCKKKFDMIDRKKRGKVTMKEIKEKYRIISGNDNDEVDFERFYQLVSKRVS